MNDLKMDLNIISGITEIDDNDAETLSGGKFTTFLGTGDANAQREEGNAANVNIEDANRLLVKNTGRDGGTTTNDQFQVFFNQDSFPQRNLGREILTSGNASRKFNSFKEQGATFVIIRQGDSRSVLN